MIQTLLLPFGEWAPDQPDLRGGITVLRNAIPQASTYRSARSLAEVSNALDSTPLRAIVAKDNSGSVFNFAADAGKIYKLSVATYADVSSGAYTATNWEFAKFGDRVIAVSPEHAPEYFDVGTSTNFATLAGTPPIAEHIAVVRDFVVLGNLDISGAKHPARVQWSGFNNSEIYGTDAGAQSDFQDLLGNGGAIQRIVPGEYGIIFQESSIWRMSYTGPPAVFRLDEVERGRGTNAKNSVCWLGSMVYYWGNDGFYSFDGIKSAPIGAEKIDRYIRGKMDVERIDEMSGTVDRRNNLVIWSIPIIGGRETVVYNWQTGRWGHAENDAVLFVEYADPGYTLDDLDLILADIDSASFNMDSSEFQGGGLSLAAFNSAKKLGTFNGAPLESEIETGEHVAESGNRMFLSSVRPLVENAGTVTIALGERQGQDGRVQYGSYKSLGPLGEANFHRDTRFLRFKVKIANGFKHTNGVQAFFKETGRL